MSKKNKKPNEVKSEAAVKEKVVSEKNKAQLEAEKMEKAAKKVQITLFPNLQVRIDPVQNVTTFEELRIITQAASNECSNKQTANAAATVILNMIARSKAKADGAEREKNIVVPGEK